MMVDTIIVWLFATGMYINIIDIIILSFYLLHVFFIQLFRELDFFQANNIFELLGLVLLSALIVLALSSKFSLTIGQPLVEGSTSKMKKWRQRKQMDDKEISA